MKSTTTTRGIHMSHPSLFTVKIKLLSICTKCKETRLREVRTPLREQEGTPPKKESVKMVCRICGQIGKTTERKIPKA